MNEKIYLKDIAGYEEEKAEAKKIIEVLKNHEKYAEIGAYIPKGLILSGNPGVGKTMLAKAIANESNVPFYEFESNESETEAATIKSIKELFKKARENAPSIIFIDEFDELVMTIDFRSDYSRKTTKILLYMWVCRTSQPRTSHDEVFTFSKSFINLTICHYF